MANPNELVAAVDEPLSAEKQSKAERAFVARLDVFLLTFGCISQVIKYLDQSNINNAYVSGMKEDLHLQGNELNLFTTYFNVAYCIMLIPSQIIMTHVRPSWWLPSVEIVWGIITGLFALTRSANQVYVLRAFLGLCESAAYPGMITLFMSWYTPTEMAKRIGFYHSCQSVGQMLSGALQAAIINSLSGKSGLAGWRWLFVVNAIITVSWGFAGYFMIPDMPNKPNPWSFWFKRVHSQLALGRLARTNRVDAKPISWSGARRTFTNWLVYVIAVLYIAMVLGTSGADYFGLFLKSVRTSDGARLWVWAYMSDFFRTRWLLIILQDSIFPWPPLLTDFHRSPTDPEGRTLIVGASIAGYYSISAWSQVLLWPASQAPYYSYGWQSACALCALAAILCVVLRIMDVRYLA
ncbi:hypothetical protein MY11210_000616 [Beauveria gryllotalpidicola]